MAVVKVFKEGNQIVIDKAGAKNGRQSEGHAASVFVRQARSGDLGAGVDVDLDDFVISSSQIGIHNVRIGPEFQNSLAVPYTRQSWVDFYRINTGFNPASGGSGAGRTFNYQAINYTDLVTNVAPVANEAELAIVYNSQGIWLINRKLKGVYMYQSGVWNYANQELQTILEGKEENLGFPSVDGHVLSSTISGTRTWISNRLNNWTLDLSAYDLTDQVPVGTDTPLKITFGAPITGVFVDLAANGEVTALSSAQVFIRSRLSIGRVTNPADSIIYIRSVIVPVVGPTILGRPVVFSLSGDDIIETFEFTAELDFESGDMFYLEFYRDSIGANDGQLRTALPTLGGWARTASASLEVWKVGDL